MTSISRTRLPCQSRYKPGSPGRGQATAAPPGTREALPGLAVADARERRSGNTSLPLSRRASASKCCNVADPAVRERLLHRLQADQEEKTRGDAGKTMTRPAFRASGSLAAVSPVAWVSCLAVDLTTWMARAIERGPCGCGTTRLGR